MQSVPEKTNYNLAARQYITIKCDSKSNHIII